jgi:CheY-like chemotaxis protein
MNSTYFALSGSNVSCEFFFSEDLLPVEIDGAQMGQVINNMIINAVQAMPQGGTIRINAENVALEASQNEHFIPLPEGEYVRISVKDDGVGIPEENQQKIFDPFFSTKPGGSGLGLATSYAIVKKHGGYIDVHSQVGVGTTFEIYLPAAATSNFLNNNNTEEIIYGNGKILIMDDEGSLREVIGDILSLLGYEVGFAKDGSEALELYKTAMDSGQPFDVVLMDLTIPGGMGGEVTIKNLLELDPEAKAIVSSGYSDNSVIANFNQYGFRGIVVKPYKIEELSRVLDEVIRG